MQQGDGDEDVGGACGWVSGVGRIFCLFCFSCNEQILLDNTDI